MVKRANLTIGVLLFCCAAFAQKGPAKDFAAVVSGTTEDATCRVVVDLSNTVEYPHKGTSVAVVREIILDASCTGGWTIGIGPVTAADATSGTALGVQKVHLGAGQTHLRIPYTVPLSSDSDQLAVTASEGLDDLFYLSTDHGSLSDAVGNATGSAGAGDWVIWTVEESAGRLNYFLNLVYTTY